MNIKQLYEKGMLLREIAKIEGCSRQTIANRLKRQGVAIRSQKEAQTKRTQRSNKYNHNCFRDIGNEKVEYWLGFMMADGNVFKQRITVRVHKKDIDHIAEFANFCGVRREPTIRGNECYITFSSKPMVDDLAKWGIVPNKSLVCEAHPELSKSRHFWRGVVDGDGCLRFSNKYPVIRLGCGSKKLMEQFRIYAQEVIRKQVNVNRRKLDTYWTISLKGQPAITLISNLYFNNTVSLFRKQQIAEKSLSMGG